MSLRKLSYVLAQAVILALWAQDWRSGTGGVYPDRILLPEALITCILGLPPALAVGLADGRTGGWRRGIDGAAVLVAFLVLLLAAWIAAAGLFAIYASQTFGTQEPPIMVRVFVLFVMEVVFAVEVVTAYLTSRRLSGSRL